MSCVGLPYDGVDALFVLKDLQKVAAEGDKKSAPDKKLQEHHQAKARYQIAVGIHQAFPRRRLFIFVFDQACFAGSLCIALQCH
jgi:hypothetical protein